MNSAKKFKISISSADEWKECGNNDFAAKRYKEALQAYTKGLSIEPKNVNIVSNRAITYINLGYFHRALEDAEAVLAIEPTHKKGIYRKAKSLCGLKRYGAGIRYLSNIFSSNPELKTNEFDILLKRLIALEKQQKMGEYDLLNLYQSSKIYHDDLADFVGPVEIVEIEGKGRGLVATKDILAGTLLYAGKAFAMVFCEKSSTTQVRSVLNMSLVEKIIEKLQIEPETGHELYELYAGAHLPLDEKLNTTIVHRDRIEGISTFNYICGSSNPLTTAELTTGGIWILPSFINNSCLDANCVQNLFGDFSILRAFCNIRKRSEITLSYNSLLLPYDMRSEIFEKYNFICRCIFCKFERAEPVAIRTQRTTLIDEITSSTGNIHKSLTLLRRLENMRCSNPEFNVELLLPLFELHFELLKIMKYQEASEVLRMANTILVGTHTARLGIKHCLRVCVIFCGLGHRDQAILWAKISLRKIRILYGSEKIVRLLNEDAFAAMIDLGFKFD